MICPQCGNELSADALFCEVCGASVMGGAGGPAETAKGFLPGAWKQIAALGAVAAVAAIGVGSCVFLARGDSSPSSADATPTAAATATSRPSPSASPSQSPSPSPSASRSPSPSVSPSPTATTGPTNTPFPGATATYTPTSTSTPSPTPTITPTPTATPTRPPAAPQSVTPGCGPARASQPSSTAPWTVTGACHAKVGGDWDTASWAFNGNQVPGVTGLDYEYSFQTRALTSFTITFTACNMGACTSASADANPTGQ